MPRRSVLFTPGDQHDMLMGALDSAADVVVFDLEDGVSTDDTPTARETIVEVLTAVETASVEVLIRLNPPEVGAQEDLEVLKALTTGSFPDGFVLPKVNAPSTVDAYRRHIEAAGFDTELWCLLESPAGVLDARAIADESGVSTLVFGGEDYIAAVGGIRTRANTELLYARQRTVAAAAAAGIIAIDGITSALEDIERVRSDATEAATFGFDGKLAIHPAQLDPINEAFTPDAEQVEWARRVIEAVEASDAGVLRVDGEMIDAPLIKRARRILDIADG